MNDKIYYKQLLNNSEELKKLYPEFNVISVVTQKSGRITCHFSSILNGIKKIKHSQIAKLILESKVKRLLVGDETVDHIDGDVTNNSDNNLQILSSLENSSKGTSELNKLKINKVKSIKMLGSLGDFCRGENNNFHKLSENEVIEIKKLQKSYIKGSGQDLIISKQYNVSRETIKSIRLNYIWKHIKVS